MQRRLLERHQVAAPLQTHWRKATCEEVDCRFFLQGFTVKTLAGPAGDRDAAAVRRQRRGEYTETANKAGGHDFVFPPGSTCLQSSIHRLKLERPELFVVARPNPTHTALQVIRRYDGAESFMEGLHDRTGEA